MADEPKTEGQVVKERFRVIPTVVAPKPDYDPPVPGDWHTTYEKAMKQGVEFVLQGDWKAFQVEKEYCAV